MLEIPVEGARIMIGHHLLWLDRNNDELLSWTTSVIFVLVHAQGRQYKGQGDPQVGFIDRGKTTRAKTPEHRMGGPVEFFNAVDLFNSFEVPDSAGFTTTDCQFLDTRMYTHELLSHGIIEYQDVEFRQVSFSELVNAGLFQLCPQLEVQEHDFPAGLYTRCVALRTQIYRDVDETTAGDSDAIDLAWKIAKLFLAGNDTHSPTTRNRRPPLYLFLMLLSLQKRPSSWPVFQTWIRLHYSSEPDC